MLIINKPSEPYLVLEALTDKKMYKNLFLITFGKDARSTIKLGRGHEC